MVKIKNMRSDGRENVVLDASLVLDEMDLMPEEVAVLKMIHTAKYE